MWRRTQQEKWSEYAKLGGPLPKIGPIGESFWAGYHGGKASAKVSPVASCDARSMQAKPARRLSQESNTKTEHLTTWLAARKRSLAVLERRGPRQWHRPMTMLARKGEMYRKMLPPAA